MRRWRRAAPYAVAVVVAIAAIMGLMWRTSTVSPAHRSGYVVIAGAAGLRWSDVTPTNTPTLWAMAGTDAIAALNVVSAHDPTCVEDGWLTLGAGNYAQWPRKSGTEPTCRDTAAPTVTSPDRIGASLGNSTADNRDLPYGTQPGALAGAVRCTVAVGPNAAIAAARSYGRVDRYAATLPARPAKLLSTCTLSIVDIGTVDATDPVIRAEQAHAVDTTLAAVLAARPPDSLVLVAGVADTGTGDKLHVAIADGPGYHGGWLTSSGTGRAGYLRLTDLAPTALAALGLPMPAGLFTGSQAQRVGERPADPHQAVAALADADLEASVQGRTTGWFVGLLVAAEIVLLLGAIPLLRRARRSVEPGDRKPVSSRIVRTVEILLVAAIAAVASVLLTDVVPWWRSGPFGLVFVALAAGVAAIIVTFVMIEPWRWLPRRWRPPAAESRPRPSRRSRPAWSWRSWPRLSWPRLLWPRLSWSQPVWSRSGSTLAPLTAAAAVVAATIGIDTLAGSRLQLNGVAGYSSATGTRFTGVGAIGLGAFIAAVLILAACLAQYVPERRWRPAVVGAVGGVGVIVAGSGQFGADAGGALALTAGVCVAAAISTGGWLTFTRLAWASLAGLVVLIGFAVLDLRRPVPQRGPVGQFLTQWHEGTAGNAVHRAAVSDVVSAFTSPLTLLVLFAIVYTVFVLNRPWGGLMRLFGLYPAIRGAMTGMAVAAVLAGLIDGNGFVTAGAAASVGLPIVTLAALRVLDHADDRTDRGGDGGADHGARADADADDSAYDSAYDSAGDRARGRTDDGAGGDVGTRPHATGQADVLL